MESHFEILYKERAFARRQIQKYIVGWEENDTLYIYNTERHRLLLYKKKIQGDYGPRTYKYIGSSSKIPNFRNGVK